MNFALHRGERLALSGGNGCGKSSLLKLICGEGIPHGGMAALGSRAIISYVPQDTSFLVGDLDEYVNQHGLDGTLFRAVLRQLDFSRVQFEKDMRDYSAGQKKKVLLARSMCQEAHLYIWDEPLNYVDVLSRMQIEDLILAYEPTMLFVEHDRAFCGKVATGTVQFMA
jgi:lincosamide and streptogramin A transport system ATP-binding/permease protein